MLFVHLVNVIMDSGASRNIFLLEVPLEQEAELLEMQRLNEIDGLRKKFSFTIHEVKILLTKSSPTTSSEIASTKAGLENAGRSASRSVGSG